MMKFNTSVLLAISCLIAEPVLARPCTISDKWQSLCKVLESRVEQSLFKMKLQESEAQLLEHYIQTTPYNCVFLHKLQYKMPKTTTELWMAIYKRGLKMSEAEKMAEFLMVEVDFYNFKNLSDFDNNTSHIIGREWDEIDYSGESMTWQKQKEKYAPYGISHFKSLECLKKFFPVESKLPYFNKVYQPMY